MFEKLKSIFSKKDVQYIQDFGYGKPYWSTQKDEQYIKEAYNKLVWVYSCVSMISSCVSSVPWVLYRKVNKNIIEIEEHPLLNLVNFKANQYMSSKDFFDLWATYLALEGKFYAEYNNPAIPTELYPLYPHYTKPIPDKTNFVSGFQYTLDTKPQFYGKENILWSKFNDPLSLYDGLSPVRALARTIDTENEAVNWNKTTLQNSAVPPGAISVVNPSPELQEKLREEWIKRYTGSKNARIPLVLNAEKASYVPFGLSAIDMDFLNQRKLNRIEICSAFGVPSQVVGDPEGQTYANYEESIKAFWQNTIIPKYLDTIKDSLNMNLASKYNNNLYFDYNLDDIKALHESVDAIAERTRNLFKDNLLSRNEARELIGFEKIDSTNLYYNDIINAQQLLQNNDENKNYLIDLIEKKNDNLENAELEQDKIKWKALDNNRDKYINKINELFQGNFDKERINVLKVIKNSTSEKDIKKAIKKTNQNKQDILKASYTSIINEYGTESYKNLSNIKEVNQFNVYDELIQKYINKITAEKVVMIDDTTLNQIKAIISESINTDSIDQIAEKIDMLYLDNIIPNRSTVIARTETVSASNYGSLAGAKKAEIDFDVSVKKKWLPTFDVRTRDTHSAMYSKPAIELNDKFLVGSSFLQFPCDFTGDASEVINCRCAITYVRK